MKEEDMLRKDIHLRKPYENRIRIDETILKKEET